MKHLIILLILISIVSSLSAYTIEETIAQIESLKKEIAHNEQIVEEKISNLKKSNPLFADQDLFESSAEYAKRLKKGQPVFDNLRKQYLDDLWQKLGILRGRLFETENVTITLSKYDPDAQIYPMKIQHLDYQKEIFNVDVNIEREKAKLLYQNWDKVKKTGILAIDFGDKICLAKIQLQEPISGFSYEYEIQPMIEIFYTYGYLWKLTSATFSPNSILLAVGSKNYNNNNHIFLYDLINKKDIKSIGRASGRTYVKFSKNNKYLIAEWEKDIQSPAGILVYNIKSGNINRNVKTINEAIFSNNGEFICYIDKVRTITTDGKYELKFDKMGSYNSYKINIFRTFAQVESDIFAQKVISRPP